MCYPPKEGNKVTHTLYISLIYIYIQKNKPVYVYLE